MLILINVVLKINKRQNKRREEKGTHGFVNRNKMIDPNPYKC